MTTKYQVILCHRTHPEWSAPQIAKKLGCLDTYVRVTAKRNGLTLPPARIRMRWNEEPLLLLGMACRNAGIGIRDIEQMAEKRG